MAKYIELEYKDLEGDYILIDLRSEGEYEEFTIPGAINIPILNNEERKEIGTVYKNESEEKAKLMAVEAASVKLPEIYQQIKELELKHDKVVLFCARGGMRSTVLDKLLVSLGFKVYKLRDGYKGYRAFINEELAKQNEDVNYLVLQGNTGSGKTILLKQLKTRGYNILDLEACANHRGSFLGSVGIGECNTQKKFESLVYEELKARRGNLVIVEGESKRIGRVLIPDYIYDSMIKGKRLLIDVDLDQRAKNIMEEYTESENWKVETIEGMKKLGKYISEGDLAIYFKMLEEGDIEELVKTLMLDYYDPMYKKGEDKYKYEITVDANSIESACHTIEEWIKNNYE